MPFCFWPVYGVKVVAIIDCYEVRIEKPSNLVAKVQPGRSINRQTLLKFLLAYHLRVS